MSFKEWKYCQVELDKLRCIDWMECPSCSQHQHSVHVDGNMKLYRFKSAGMLVPDINLKLKDNLFLLRLMSLIVYQPQYLGSWLVVQSTSVGVVQ